MDEDSKRALDEFLREQINIETMKKYIFVRNMSKRYDEEYLDRMYRINCEKTKKLYENMDENTKRRLEKKITDQIAAGEINLYEEAVKWYREGLRKAHIKEISKPNNDNGEER